MALPDIRSMMQGRRPGAGPKTAPPSAQAMVPALEAPGGIQSFRIAANAQESPESITARRERWGNAVEGPLDVYTPDPLTAGAKALTMGLGGWQQSRADKAMDTGRQGYQAKLAQMLETGKMDPSIMGDAFATPQGSQMAMKMWDRQNPEPMSPQQQLEMKINEARLAQMQQERAWAAEDRNKPEKPPGWEVKGDAKSGFFTYDPRDPEGTWTAMPRPEGATAPAIEDADLALKVGKNFEGSTGFQRYQMVAPTLNSMYQSINDPTAMADLDFVYGLAKILDPTSVVRESEAGMVIDAQGIAPSMLGQLNKFISGGQAMSPQIRADLFSVAQRRAEELRSQAEGEREHFSGVLEKQQLDPETYLQNLTPTPKWEEQNMQGQGVPSQQMGQAQPAPQQPQPQPVPQASQDDAVIQRQQAAPPGVPGRLWSQLQNDPEFLADIQAAQGNPKAMQELMQILQQEFPDYFDRSGW